MNMLFSKEKYSEYVMRNSLYWMSQYCEWELNDLTDNWEVIIPEENKKNLDNLVNDFKLREMIGFKTNDVRERIIYNALKRVELGVVNDPAS